MCFQLEISIIRFLIDADEFFKRFPRCPIGRSGGDIKAKEWFTSAYGRKARRTRVFVAGLNIR